VSKNIKPNRNGRILLTMLLLFGAPYLFAWYFFFSGTALEIGNSSNRGNLVSPMQPMPEVQYQLHDGTQVTSAELADHWLMITVADGCDDLCGQALIIMQQSRRAQAVNRQYIKRMLVLTSAQDQAEDIAAKYQGTLVATAVEANGADAMPALLSAFEGLEAQQQGSIYLVDPRSNVMMTYNSDMPRDNLLKDMERLFKVIKMD